MLCFLEFIVASWQKTGVMRCNAFAQCATLLMDPMSGFGEAFISVLTDRILSEINSVFNTTLKDLHW